MSDEETEELAPETKRGVITWFVRELFGVLSVAVLLMIPAGRLDWIMGWVLVGIYAAWFAASAALLIPKSPELLAERVSRKENVEPWDTALLSIIGLTTLAKYVLAGLEARRPPALPSLGWTVPDWVQIAAAVVAAAGYALVTWAMVANAYFSKVMRIQDDRGQTVASGGPYRWVRHPGYTGTLAFELATPFMLDSLWALIPSAVTVALTVVRTALEDRTLRDELEGYREYARRVRYRLLPGLW